MIPSLSPFLPDWWPPTWGVEIRDVPERAAMLVYSGDYIAGIIYRALVDATVDAESTQALFHQALAMNGAKLGADALGAWATEIRGALLAHVPDDPPGPGRGDPWCDDLCAFGRHSLVPASLGGVRCHRCTWCHQEFPSSCSPLLWRLR